MRTSLSVAKSSLLFASGTLLSRIAGLFRDRIVLAVFGASEIAEGFTVAFRIPNLLREMLAEGALGSAFTKVYSSLSATDPARAKRLLWDAFRLMLLVAVAVCALGAVLSPWIVRLVTADVDHRQVLTATATGLTPLLFPFLGFMILGAVAMGALHQSGRFFLTSISPIFYNLFSILGAVVLAGLFQAYAPDWVETTFADKAITGLAVGVLLGGLAQLLVQLFGIVGELREGRRQPGGALLSPDVRRVLWLMAPMSLAASAGQINTMINQYFATTAESGAVMWLYASFRLLHFPIGLFGVAISAAVLPSLARALVKTEARAVGPAASREMQNAAEMVLWLMAPCFIFYVVNDLEIVRCLFQSGNYSPYDAEQTAIALHAYSYALIAYGLSKVMTSFYFAMERTRFALKVSLVNVVANALANYILVERYGHEGIAYGYSVTQALGVSLLIFGMRGHGVTLDRPRFARSLGMMAAASVLAALLMRGVLTATADLEALRALPLWLSSGLILLVNGGLCFGLFAAGALAYLRMPPRAAWRALARRRRGA